MLLALTLTAITLSVPAMLEPLFIVNVYGRARANVIFTGVASLWTGTLWPLALMVLSFAMLIPAVWLGALLIVLLCLTGSSRPLWLPYAFRTAEALDQWAMPDVFMVGSVVAYTRLRALAATDVAAGGWCFFVFAMVVMALRILIDREQIWSAIGGESQAPDDSDRLILACPACALALPEAFRSKPCPRCKAAVRERKPESFNQALAVLLAAYLLYVPANLLPVLKVVQLGGSTDSTIVGGIRELAEAGMWPLAIIVFTASIAIPILKLIGLAWCLNRTRQRSASRLIERTLLYRIIDRIGRWSSIDVFVVSILTALMQFGMLGTVRADAGAVAFGAVVVLTMLASRVFDSRIMWDAGGVEHE
jgi:paraquat-inducible protein A